ncbi:MAG: flagellar biosynthesis protein FliQ [Oscillospiraceae bacterium]|nr:flagellar biosynthesis protein FliQ [Oscillospiraceae bacterium]MBQ8378635.1 flagellar biosynthesis protein FliQ [Oscillospiraceae bacterium]MBQ8883050.1 flagellar biosynthesis protein FliQ [Oscillospiraceae bacterium]
MSAGDVINIFHEALVLSLKLAGPILIASILIGLVVAIFQAATQIHEQTLTFVPKLLVIAIILLVCGSWMITNLNEFFEMIFKRIMNL